MLAGWDAAPAGGDGRTPAPGRPRDPIGGHYGPSARSSLDWDCANDCRCAETPPAHKGATPRPAGSAQTPGNADPGIRNRRRGAPRGARTFWNEGAARLKTGAPLGAPPPRCFEGHEQGPAPAGWKTAYPGPIKNTGDDACLGANRASPARAALACRAEAQRRRAV